LVDIPITLRHLGFMSISPALRNDENNNLLLFQFQKEIFNSNYSIQIQQVPLEQH
jgi:hypothetical protein